MLSFYLKSVLLKLTLRTVALRRQIGRDRLERSQLLLSLRQRCLNHEPWRGSGAKIHNILCRFRKRASHSADD